MAAGIFWMFTNWRTLERKHKLVERSDSVPPHPAGDSSGPPQCALWDQPSKPLTHCDSLPFYSVFLQQYNYTHWQPQEHSLCREGIAQYSVVFPAAHVIIGWKSTDTKTGIFSQRARFPPHRNICRLMLRVRPHFIFREVVK